MPLIKVKKNGQTCWKWGTSGKLYCGPGAREKAVKQSQAIRASQRASGKRTHA